MASRDSENISGEETEDIEDELEFEDEFEEPEDNQADDVKNARIIRSGDRLVYVHKSGTIQVHRKEFPVEGNIIWEIVCTRGNLFDGHERFRTKGAAVRRIRELLWDSSN